MTRSTAPTAPDGRPMAGPFDRAGWREWLIANHEASKGVYLLSWRRGSGRTSVSYEEAVEEALCVGWIDSSGRVLDEERSIQWFAPRRARSVWARSNKQRVARLTVAGLMLPAGLAAIEDAKLSGMWTLLDDVEDLLVPDDLATALKERPTARDRWDAFPPSARRAMLQWVVEARRPETRAGRIARIVDGAERDERAYPPG